MRSHEPQNRWLSEALSPGTLITLFMLVMSFLAQWFTLGARETTNEADIRTLNKRADDYDKKFERMPREYVMRTELQDMLTSIREDTRDMKMDLRALQRPQIPIYTHPEGR